MRDAGVLVMAKAPVPGQAKTRLAATVGDLAAADLAAAALLDTLAVVEASGLRCVVAWSGDLASARRAHEVGEALARCLVIPQRGRGLADRLVAAHHDASALLGGTAVVQIGMDTPQLAPAQLVSAAAELMVHDAVLGLAEDGGWWLLGVRTASLTVGLGGVATSREETGRRTLSMLVQAGASVGLLEVLRDVDTLADAHHVADHPSCGRRFTVAVATVAVRS